MSAVIRENTNSLNFNYSITAHGLQEAKRKTSECFLNIRRGYIVNDKNILSFTIFILRTSHIHPHLLRPLQEQED